MPRRTAQLTVAAEQDQAPPDVETMRETAARLLGPDDGPEALPPAPAEVDLLTLRLRGHLEVLIPDVEEAVGPRPANVQAYCALACVGEARRKLAITPRPELSACVAHARRLARVLLALCTHHEELNP
jgi:hypothetical protein